MEHSSGDPLRLDFIGDVHGCADELVALLEALGYRIDGAGTSPPQGRRAIFLGDLVNRGPGIVAVLRLVMAMVSAGRAECLAGNHDINLLRGLRAEKVDDPEALKASLKQI